MQIKLKDLKVGDKIRTGLFSWGTVQSIECRGGYALVITEHNNIYKPENNTIQKSD